MAKPIYSAIASLDGCVEDEHGQIGWAMPGEEEHAFVNELERRIGSHLYVRRMYETAASWETIDTGPAQNEEIATGCVDPQRRGMGSRRRTWRRRSTGSASRTRRQRRGRRAPSGCVQRTSSGCLGRTAHGGDGLKQRSETAERLAATLA